MKDDDPRHGTRRGYYAHRRVPEDACGPCKRAAAAEEQRYVLIRMRGGTGRVPAVGTKRRLRALQAVGWTLTDIAAELDTKRSRVEKWCNEEKTYVYTATAARVADVYERLCMRQPTGRWATRTRNTALRRGYLPPLAWLDIDDPNERPDLSAIDNLPDPVVVERILAGDWRLKATPAERAEVVARWSGSVSELERLTGWNAARDARNRSAA